MFYALFRVMGLLGVRVNSVIQELYFTIIVDTDEGLKEKLTR